jgi:hypothetical protein
VVRLVAVLVGTQQDIQAADLQPTDYQQWRDLRAQRHFREGARRQRFRFRKDPSAYLAALEAQLLEESFPFREKTWKESVIKRSTLFPLRTNVLFSFFCDQL